MKENWSEKEGSRMVYGGKALQLLERFLPASARRVSPRLLDMGSGNGFFVETLPSYFAVDAADAENFLSEKAQQRLNSFTALNLNALWPFQNDYYDALTAWNVLEHLENPFHFAREAVRVLKPGGFLFVSVPNVFNARNRIFFLRTGDMTRYHAQNSHIMPFTKYTLNKIFSHVMLRQRGFLGFDFPFFPKRFSRFFFRHLLKNTEFFGQTLYIVFQKKY